MELIKKNIAAVKARIETSMADAGRDQQSLQLLAVSKTRDEKYIKSAFSLGLNAFGENYLQEALPKIDELKDLPLCWHFIGPIQSNKTISIAEHFDWVHTVSSLKVAKRLNDQRPESAPPLNVLIQVNIDREDSKSGVLPEDTDALIDATREMGQLNLRGLMVIPKKSKDLDLIRDSFARTRLLQESIANRYCLAQFNQLSMGMSEDLELAIAEGATIIRIGSALFGPRDA